ncbi:hypothetical protein F9B85_10365 [Heliorestis acidaminivorans]|uniref:Uncharacterized protein n=1 Tax=Heliorestis acidaminivorans TaxID=553427 RepID=A0A6I0EXJ5_9FIRM|nr:hypothetical protein [Heliorestis acidaminivorans]KAB2951953.1 hypothetical protein F9B85_10365 [Heliorestis acidaminivorans]
MLGNGKKLKIVSKPLPLVNRNLLDPSRYIANNQYTAGPELVYRLEDRAEQERIYQIIFNLLIQIRSIHNNRNTLAHTYKSIQEGLIQQLQQQMENNKLLIKEYARLNGIEQEIAVLYDNIQSKQLIPQTPTINNILPPKNPLALKIQSTRTTQRNQNSQYIHNKRIIQHFQSFIESWKANRIIDKINQVLSNKTVEQHLSQLGQQKVERQQIVDHYQKVEHRQQSWPQQRVRLQQGIVSRSLNYYQGVWNQKSLSHQQKPEHHQKSEYHQKIVRHLGLKYLQGTVRHQDMLCHRSLESLQLAGQKQLFSPRKLWTSSVNLNKLIVNVKKAVNSSISMTFRKAFNETFSETAILEKRALEKSIIEKATNDEVKDKNKELTDNGLANIIIDGIIKTVYSSPPSNRVAINQRVLSTFSEHMQATVVTKLSTSLSKILTDKIFPLAVNFARYDGIETIVVQESAKAAEHISNLVLENLSENITEDYVHQVSEELLLKSISETRRDFFAKEIAEEITKKLSQELAVEFIQECSEKYFYEDNVIEKLSSEFYSVNQTYSSRQSNIAVLPNMLNTELVYGRESKQEFFRPSMQTSMSTITREYLTRSIERKIESTMRKKWATSLETELTSLFNSTVTNKITDKVTDKITNGMVDRIILQKSEAIESIENNIVHQDVRSYVAKTLLNTLSNQKTSTISKLIAKRTIDTILQASSRSISKEKINTKEKMTFYNLEKVISENITKTIQKTYAETTTDLKLKALTTRSISELFSSEITEFIEETAISQQQSRELQQILTKELTKELVKERAEKLSEEISEELLEELSKSTEIAEEIKAITAEVLTEKNINDLLQTVQREIETSSTYYSVIGQQWIRKQLRDQQIQGQHLTEQELIELKLTEPKLTEELSTKQLRTIQALTWLNSFEKLSALSTVSGTTYLTKKFVESITDKITERYKAKVTEQVIDKFTVIDKVTNKFTNRFTNKFIQKVTNTVTDKVTTVLKEKVTDAVTDVIPEVTLQKEKLLPTKASYLNSITNSKAITSILNRLTLMNDIVTSKVITEAITKASIKTLTNTLSREIVGKRGILSFHKDILQNSYASYTTDALGTTTFLNTKNVLHTTDVLHIKNALHTNKVLHTTILKELTRNQTDYQNKTLLKQEIKQMVLQGQSLIKVEQVKQKSSQTVESLHKPFSKEEITHRREAQVATEVQRKEVGPTNQATDRTHVGEIPVEYIDSEEPILATGTTHTLVSQSNEEMVNELSDKILEKIETNPIFSISTIAEQVYDKIEKKLTSERRRRGLL